VHEPFWGARASAKLAVMKPAVLGPRGTSLAAFAALTVSLGIHGSAHARTVTVNAGCTLPDAVNTVNTQVPTSGCAFRNRAQPDDVILLPTEALTLTAPLEFNRSVTVRGSSSTERSTLLAEMTIDSFFLRVVDPSNTGSVRVTFDNLNIERQTGNPNVTGIYAFGAVVTIQNSYLGGFRFNGIVSDDSDLSIFSSTIDNNSSFWPGAGIQFNNASFQTRPTLLDIGSSSISNNSSGGPGGGVYISDGNASIHETAIFSNLSITGGGVYTSGGNS